MAKYNAMWVGLDRGHEGLWIPAVWYKTLLVLCESNGSNYQDCSDPLYERLKDKVPEVEWVSTEADGRKRGLFRDAREPWDSLNVVSFNENIVSLTDKGRSVCTGILSYSDVLISGLMLHEENDEYPFRIIASAFLETDGRIALTPDLIAGKIMPNYRPLIDDIHVTLSAAAEPMSTTQVRRIRNMLQLMSYAGALVKVDSSKYMMANRSVLDRIAGGGGVTLKFPLSGFPLQLITYGAPGTGKSHKVDGLAKNPDVAACVRTTFHPDSDYATFVGAYKPVMDGEKIAYKFRPQAFMNAYVKAWQEWAKVNGRDARSPSATGETPVVPVGSSGGRVVLVIEEINRGNCAQIFGDLFQLLDRGKDGYSTYPIDADVDLATWLAEELGKLDADAQERVPPEVRSGEKLVLPPNLYIWATMNTSDQSLFPIDSAFKRRWDWEYVPIAKPDKSDDQNWKERKIEVGDSLFDWWDFLSAINGHIAKATESEDKQLGYFFVKADDATGCISAEQFANKVLFYLYGDVFKSYELPKKDCFQQADNTVLKFRDFFYSEKVEEGEGENRVIHKPGDVKLDVVAAFLRGLKWKEKGVKEEPKGGAADANPD